MDWYYATPENEQIATDEDTLRRMIAGGLVTPNTLIWCEDLPDWAEAGTAKPEWFPAPALQAPAASMPVNPGAPAFDPATVFAEGGSSGNLPVPSPPAGSAMPPLPPPAPPADGLAVASLVCGILGLLGNFCYGFGLPVSLAAVICAHLSRRKARREGRTGGEGMSLAGLITGYVGLAIGVVFLLIFGAILVAGVATGLSEQPQ
ncbi:MAG: DUF4190 domain-containing protein [Verrucomicrobiae bacterium]|nr:DUF4190 domain-containing protein [Verrucomicrobiae bacterium]MCP5540409.1 DUF4190 domain-containing protein [Akkermansiaceae bacterium]